MSDRLQEIRARLDAATPGPWTNDDGWIVSSGPNRFYVTGHAVVTADADLIAHAPADIAWLLQEVARLTLQERSMKRIHADLQSRYQIATSEKKRGYTMDVRMVNDGRTF